ncbi:MAG: DNA repair protein RecO [Planctomycetota bacterium]|jgi:DNA repair protein RecO|nr:DNA repair protein RecO [Planctomycetota bacterium]
MQNKLKSVAIVLRRWPYSESSLVFRAITPQLGTVSVLAKGVQKLKSGNIGVIDTWALIEVELSRPPKSEIFNLIKARLIDRMSGLSNDIQVLNAAGILVEIAETGAPPEQESRAIFIWLQKWLQRLSEGDDPQLVLCRAIIEALELLGLNLQLPSAIEHQSYWFSPADGGCLIDSSKPRPDLAARTAKASEIDALRQIAHANDTNLPNNLGNLAACITLLGDFLHYHLERLPKAWQMYIKSQPATN